MSVSTNKDAIINNSFFSQEVNEKEKKDKEKQSEELANLLAVLSQVEEIIALSESGSDVTLACEQLSKKSILPHSDKTDGKENEGTQTAAVCGSSSQPQPSDYAAPKDCPSNQEMADALACMSAMISDLEMTAQETSNEQYANAIKIMITQMKNAEQILINYENTTNQVQEEWDAYCAYINKMMNAYNAEMYMYSSSMGMQAPNPLMATYMIENDIENWVSANLGFSISLNPSDITVESIINDANTQVKAGLDKQMEAASNLVYAEMCCSSNPITREIGKLIFKNAEFTEEVMKQLTMIMDQALKSLELLSDLSSLDMSQGPSNALMIQIMTNMTQTLSDMEAMITITKADQVKFSEDASQKMQTAAKDALDKATKQLDKISKLSKAQKRNELINKIVTIATTVIICAAAIALGQPEIALMAATMCALQESGANKKMTDSLANEISKSLQKNGLSKDEADRDAKVISEAIVIVVETALTLGVGMYSGSFAAAETVAEEAAEVGTEVAEIAADESVTQMMYNMLEKASAYNPFKALPAGVNFGFINAAQLTMSENLAYDASIASQGSGKGELSSREKKEMENKAMKTAMAIDITLSLLMMLAMPYSMKSASAEESSLAKGFAKLIKEHPVTFFQAMYITSAASAATQTYSMADMSYNYKQQADATKKLGYAEAEEKQYFNLSDALNQMAMDTANQQEQTLSSRSKADSDMLRNIYSYMSTYTNVINSAV